MREGVARLLERQDDLEVVATCDDYDSLLAAVETHRPDVVLTDIRMPPTGTDEGVRAAEHLRVIHPEIGVVALSQYADPVYALGFLGKGSERRAYLLKERVSDIEQLHRAIVTVHEGGSVIDPKVVDALVASRSRSRESPVARLTPGSARCSPRWPRARTPPPRRMRRPAAGATGSGRRSAPRRSGRPAHRLSGHPRRDHRRGGRPPTRRRRRAGDGLHPDPRHQRRSAVRHPRHGTAGVLGDRPYLAHPRRPGRKRPSDRRLPVTVPSSAWSNHPLRRPPDHDGSGVSPPAGVAHHGGGSYSSTRRASSVPLTARRGLGPPRAT